MIFLLLLYIELNRDRNCIYLLYEIFIILGH